MEPTIAHQLHLQAQRIRNISRAEIFNRKRHFSTLFPDYLARYDISIRTMLEHSMTEPIPEMLPPVSIGSISLYRRSMKGVFQSRENGELDGHLLYESLWMLSGLQEQSFKEYGAVVGEFERDFRLYWEMNSESIREMAVLAAGNRIIGKEADILELVKTDPRQLWVLVNHIYEKKIPVQRLLAYIVQGSEVLAYRALSEMTNLGDQDCIGFILQNELVLTRLLAALSDPSLRIHALLVFGNLLAEGDSPRTLLDRYRLIDFVTPFLSHSHSEIRRESCWLLSNYALESYSATSLLRKEEMVSRMVQLAYSESIKCVKTQLAYLLSHIAGNAEEGLVYRFFGQNLSLVQVLMGYLSEKDEQLSAVTLSLLWRLLKIGKELDGQENIFQRSIHPSMIEEITICTYSSNKTLAGLAESILKDCS